MRITRLAPSPTGALHLGNARTFLANWLLARQRKWRILLRIEDLDGPRVKPDATTGLIEDLQWLGLEWDEAPIFQSSRTTVYEAYVQLLLRRGKAYPCICSRKEIEAAASAPHAEDGSTIYPGTCRGRFASVAAARQAAGREPAIRFKVPAERVVTFHDEVAGDCSYHVSRDLGDFVIAKGDGTPAYQLAVVVDDAAAGVTDVVRGDDLLDSTPRQILLYEAFGMAERVPNYYHFPLVVGTDGRRLAKRHGDTRLSYYRDLGVGAERVIALLARWCGIDNVGERVAASSLVDRFDFSAVPTDPITFAADDEAWLRSAIAASHAPTAGPR